LLPSLGTGATLCCSSPAVEEADKLLRHVRGIRRDENLVIGIQNQRHGLLDLRPRPPDPGGAPANAFHTFWCPPRRKVSCQRNLSVKSLWHSGSSLHIKTAMSAPLRFTSFRLARCYKLIRYLSLATSFAPIFNSLRNLLAMVQSSSSTSMRARSRSCES